MIRKNSLTKTDRTRVIQEGTPLKYNYNETSNKKQFQYTQPSNKISCLTRTYDYTSEITNITSGVKNRNVSQEFYQRKVFHQSNKKEQKIYQKKYSISNRQKEQEKQKNNQENNKKKKYIQCYEKNDAVNHLKKIYQDDKKQLFSHQQYQKITAFEDISLWKPTLRQKYRNGGIAKQRNLLSSQQNKQNICNEQRKSIDYNIYDKKIQPSQSLWSNKQQQKEYLHQQKIYQKKNNIQQILLKNKQISQLHSQKKDKQQSAVLQYQYALDNMIEHNFSFQMPKQNEIEQSKLTKREQTLNKLQMVSDFNQKITERIQRVIACFQSFKL